MSNWGPVKPQFKAFLQDGFQVPPPWTLRGLRGAGKLRGVVRTPLTVTVCGNFSMLYE